MSHHSQISDVKSRFTAIVAKIPAVKAQQELKSRSIDCDAQTAERLSASTRVFLVTDSAKLLKKPPFNCSYMRQNV
jgi:hypothetical protein